MLKVSVITIGYNCADVIARTMESVLAQTYPEIEYIVIDGASKDGTAGIARSYAEAFTDRGYSFTVVSEPDRGIYDAMNKGISRATGDIIGLINSGDWYEPCAVETAAGAYEREPYDLFYADINLVRESGDVMVKHSRHDRFPTSRHWNHPTMFVTRETYSSLGLYRCEGIHDDFEFFLRARRAGRKCVIENKVLANFMTGGASNDKSFRKCVKRCRDRYRAYRLNGYSPLSMIECAGIEIAKLILS